MGRAIFFNCLMNGTFAVVFVMLNQWALQNQFEETFVTLAIVYGCIVIVSNAIFLVLIQKR